MITIIVPVFRGLDDTKKCLDALINSKKANRTPFQIIAINDCSPETAIVELLQTYSLEGTLNLIEHEVNVGFVGSVNEGMQVDVSSDIVLLNSDAVVANNWLDRMRHCAYSAANIGTVTPFSNNATICSFPVFCKENDVLAGFSVGDIDLAFAKANKGGVVEIPTAVGFCMYIKRDCLNNVGLFDEKTFGRGYGEENDFCRRAVKLKWLNVLCADTFVAHIGGVSFSEEKSERVENAQRQLDRLHPEYHQCVQDHIIADPARPYRIRAMSALVSTSGKPKVIFLAHHLGGGVEHHLNELSCYLSEQAHFLILRPTTDQRNFSLYLHECTNDRLNFILPDEFNDLIKVLKDIGIGLVHYHHTIGIHSLLMSLPAQLGIPYYFTIHDYYLINANPTLTDNTGRFCEDYAYRDEICQKHYKIPDGVSANSWRDNHREFLTKCRNVYAPTKYTADLFSLYFPETNPIVAYHPDYDIHFPYPSPKAWPNPLERPLRVVVIGAISREKGADILEKTALLATAKQAKLTFHLLGYAYRELDEAVITHGSYSQNELESKLHNIAPDVVWLPAQWPETYSYTLSEALRNGYPVVVPNLGAFPERVKNRPLSLVEQWDNNPEQWLNVFEKLASGETIMPRSKTVWNIENPYNYKREYLSGVSHTEGLCTDEILSRIIRHLSIDARTNLSNKEKVLLLILKIRRYKLVSFLIRFIPYNLQRRIKRWLSRRPIHLIKH